MILNLIVMVADRDRAAAVSELMEGHRLPIVLTMLARGTATSETLDLYGLEATEKALIMTVAGEDMTRQLIRANTVDTLRAVRRRYLFYLTDKKMKFVVYFTFIRNLFARLQDRTHCVKRIGFLSEPKNSAIDLFFV